MHVHILGSILLERSVEVDLALHSLDLVAFFLSFDYHLRHVAPIDVAIVLATHLDQPTLLLPIQQTLR